ncbi:MAG: ribosome small subunit-dependent GTPase A [Bryobacteraceae bacterium]
MTLDQLGWSDHFARLFEPSSAEGCTAARVAVVHRGQYTVFSAAGDHDVELSGRFLHQTQHAEELPVTGDWVVLRRGANLIDAVLPRRTRLLRRQPGAPVEAQAMAANIDVLFLVTGLDGDFNLRRLERYLVLANESGARPVIVLNKADLCANPPSLSSLGAPVLIVSATRGDNMDAFSNQMRAGETAAFIGSSGAGKSSLVNSLLGRAEQPTAAVRVHDSRGRHTTTNRELIALPDGWLVIDMPGIREVALWVEGDGFDRAFADVGDLALHCRFRDCTHNTEPGCAVRDSLDAERLHSFHKLRRELDHLHRQVDQRAAAEYKARNKRLHLEMRRRPKP